MYLHHMHDAVSGRRIGASVWTFTLLTCTVADSSSSVMASAAICSRCGCYLQTVRPRSTASHTTELAVAYWPLLCEQPLALIAIALINGSHGISFTHKCALVGLLLVDNLVLVAVCGMSQLGVALCQAGVVVVGATVAHVAELYAAAPTTHSHHAHALTTYALPNHG